MNITAETTGRWGLILPALGFPGQAMTKAGKPCPMCGGHDRFSYDDLEGRGTYLCRKCGAGDGFTLVQKYHGWSFRQAADAVRQVLGIQEKDKDKGFTRIRGPLPNPPPKPPPKPPPTASYARQLWEACSRDDDFVAAHPYATRKRIMRACAAGRGRVSGRVVGQGADCLIVPMRGLDGALAGVECINPEGKKQSFGKKSLLILGNDLDPALPMVIFEGFASTVKWLDSRRWNACGVVSFGKGTASKEKESVQAHYPDHVVMVGVEHD